MPTTPAFYVNSPTSGTAYNAAAGYQFIPTNATSITVDVWAYTGANGTGSLIAVTSITAATEDVTDASVGGTFTANNANHAQVISSNLVNGARTFAARGSYSGGGIGSLKLQATYTGSPVIPTGITFTPSAGGPGTSVSISGSNFSGATSVTFNGVAASSFTVNSNTSITATVPTGATTGVVHVANPSGGSDSAATFTVAQLYVNTGTPASPVWTAAVVYINTGTPAAPVWTVASEVDVNTGTPASPTWTPTS